MKISSSTKNYYQALKFVNDELQEADYIIVGAGAGLSTSAGFTYSGKRFTDNFADFIERYNFKDLYSAGFYPFKTLEEYWAFWSRNILINRYQKIPKSVYSDLLNFLKDRNYFIITTNVDHCFQRTGFDKKRLFYTQGDFGLWQCSIPCHKKTYDNETIVKLMVSEQSNLRIPSELIPYCPHCGKPMTMNLRIDNTFVEDDGWHNAYLLYDEFIKRKGKKVFLELGVGDNTPVIIKYPFWEMTRKNPDATYIAINLETNYIPAVIADRSIELTGDIGKYIADIQGIKSENEAI